MTSGAGGAFWAEEKRKREEYNAKRVEQRTHKRKGLRVERDRIEEAKPAPMDDPLPPEFHGKSAYELGQAQRQALNSTRPTSFKWLAVYELDQVIKFWQWKRLQNDFGWPVTRSNVLRFLAQIEWRVRRKMMEADAAGTWATDPFCAVINEAMAVMVKLPCRGPGVPGRRAGVSPYRRIERKSFEDVEPESYERRRDHET